MSGTSDTRRRLVNLALIAAVAALSVLVWQMHSEIKRLKAGPASVPPSPVSTDEPAHTGPADAASSEHAAADTTSTDLESSPAVGDIPPAVPPSPPAVVMEQTPTGMFPKPRSSGLMLAETRVEPIEGGTRARMRFTPTTTEPLGIIDIVVRLPRDGESKILGLDAVGSARFSAMAQRVAEDGKFAIFHGNYEGGEAIEFALSVSGEAVADVRGTAGIGPFDLTISPAGAVAQPK